MARKTALPKDALDRLIDEVKPIAVDHALRAGRGSAPGPGGVRARPQRTRTSLRGKVKKGRVGAYGPSKRSREETNPFSRNHDAVVRYATARGVQVGGGPVEQIKLALQLVADVREVARRERVGVFTVVSRALAGYLTDLEDRT